MRRSGWTRLCNRADSVLVAPDGVGLAIDAPYSSELHACRIFRCLGTALYRQAFRQWPIQFGEQAGERERPELSFIIPHRGQERLPLLQATIRSILGQRGCRVECIVVEQGPDRDVTGLPREVRHVHLPYPADPVSWRKSLAFNVGVQLSRAEMVVCHDGDILVPAGYGQEILRRLRHEDCQVAFLQRFLFYLSADDTRRLTAGTGSLSGVTTPCVVQNWRGGTLAIQKSAYWAIGGFDERFVNWTGEDLEFYDRCLTLAGYRYGYLPFVHLWHPPQATKVSLERDENLRFTRDVMAVPREDRVSEQVRRTKDAGYPRTISLPTTEESW